ncbi:F-box/LRR-repeat protein 25 [Eucalyptus grandis]|uniref:F-box/LRR-repeat protein 25 n=1 Tax=Eucalyptus grandis TaxID=71139 RepID=UPI00192EAC19|nr:F-box/LRR-repeat protein 25 [Eucalyptus grandis]
MAGKRRLLISPLPPAAEVDHISHLPDAIIHRIFSFLPFKDVVKTSMLSRQWRFAWTSTPYIDLSPRSDGVLPSTGRALSLCTAAKIEKFHLDASSMSGLYIPLYWWFRIAVARKVEDASLGLDACITPYLEPCAIVRRWLRNKKIMKILSGSPVLESLTLQFLPSNHNLWIDSRSLRESVIEADYIPSLNSSALNLLSLRLSGGSVLTGFRLNLVFH